MQNLAKHLSTALLTKLPMWSNVEIETVTDDTLVLVASLPANDEVVPGTVRLKLVETFRFELSGSSAGVSHPTPRGMIPAEFADHWQTVEALRKDLDKWWGEITFMFWAVRRDETERRKEARPTGL